MTRLQRRGRPSMSFFLGQDISRGDSSTSDLLSPSLSTAIERLGFKMASELSHDFIVVGGQYSSFLLSNSLSLH
jgi:hypothetical protein